MTTQEPPHASSWATPPEFYLDENLSGKTVRRYIADLGYRVHTAVTVLGRAAADGLRDDEWLPLAGRHGWVVICRDQQILARPEELKAYLEARVHLFLLPGSIDRHGIVELLRANLREMCTLATARQPNVYWLTRHGVESYERRTRRRRRRI